MGIKVDDSKKKDRLPERNCNEDHVEWKHTDVFWIWNKNFWKKTHIQPIVVDPHLKW